ncbi:MAG: L,D-transpeptidase family protein [Bacteroidota bacterium]
MFKSFLIAILFSSFYIGACAQVLDSIRLKTPKKDTLILITQQDVNDYISLRNITDTVGNLESYLKVIGDAKQILAMQSRWTYDHALQFTERSEKFQKIIKKPITAADISEYMAIRKIVGDTTGKTPDYLKIIKSAKLRFHLPGFMKGLYKEVDYETALKEEEENLRLRNMVDKVLVIKSQRKMYLQKKGKTIKTYTIGLGPKPIGQKEYEGDGKTPEGIYKLDYQKWDGSTFHSFHLSYPNDIDKARAKKRGLTAGSNIMIHGTSKGIKKKKDWTNGCIALNNIDMAEFKKMVYLETEVEIRK